MTGSGKSEVIKNKLISNTIYLFLDWFALSIIGFFFWFVAGKFLLPEQYGIVSTSVNLAILVGGASLIGLNFAVWKLVPEYLARKEGGKINSLVKFSLKITLVSNSIIVLIFLIFSSVLSQVLKIPPNAVLMSGAIMFTYSVALQLRFVIYSFQNMKKIAVTDIIGQISKLTISVLLVVFGFKYFGPLIGFLISNIVVILLRVSSIPFKGKADVIDKKSIMTNYALPAFVIGLGWLIFTNGQYILINALKGPEITGVYTVAMVLTSFLVIIPTTLNSALLPITSGLSVENGAKNKQGVLIGIVLRYSLLVTIPLAMLLLLFSQTAILLFSRAEYLSASQFFPLLVLGSLIYGISAIFLDNIYAIGKPKTNRNIVVVMTLIFALLAIPLTHVFSALGTALAYTISATLLTASSYIYLRRKMRLHIPIEGIDKLAISTLVSFGMLYLATNLFPTIVIKLTFACLALIVYALLLFSLRFYTLYDTKILDFFAGKFPVLKKQIMAVRNILYRRVK